MVDLDCSATIFSSNSDKVSVIRKKQQAERKVYGRGCPACYAYRDRMLKT